MKKPLGIIILVGAALIFIVSLVGIRPETYRAPDITQQQQQEPQATATLYVNTYAAQALISRGNDWYRNLISFRPTLLGIKDDPDRVDKTEIIRAGWELRVEALKEQADYISQQIHSHQKPEELGSIPSRWLAIADHIDTFAQQLEGLRSHTLTESEYAQGIASALTELDTATSLAHGIQQELDTYLP